MSFDERDDRRDRPEGNIFDAGMRGIARGLEELRGFVTQIADPTAAPRPRPVSGPGRRPPRRQPRPLPANSAGAREPLVDIFDEGEVIRVVADMPGADPETLRLQSVGPRLLIAASGPARRYERTVILPAAVRADAIAPTFVNGIMEVLLPAARETAPPPPATEPNEQPTILETPEVAAPPILLNGARDGADGREDETDDRDQDGAGNSPAR